MEPHPGSDPPGHARGGDLGDRRRRTPEGLASGYYVRPTVFADVTNQMTIAREEIFGPVLCVIGYDDVEDAIAIANDTEYGLAAFVQAGSESRPRPWPGGSRPA